uniref:Peptidase A2 domain-containing protein n=1 Tax=Scylla olivacea TaxID=85551 RepID=A0A0P4WEL4_SCYOL
MLNIVSILCTFDNFNKAVTNMSAPSGHQVLRSKKRKLKEDAAVLELVLDPPSVAVKKRRLHAHPCLSVSRDNYLVGIINGVRCNVQLDTGSTITVLFWSLAKMLGLITGRETTTPCETELWWGTTTLKVVELKSITIDLGSGVVVVTPATVFPQWLESHYNLWDVVLDAHQLRRGRMVQVFRPDGGELFVRNPDQLRRRVKKTKRSMQVDVMRVKLAQTSKREALSMLVDTGAHGMYVSSKRRELLA